VQVEALLRREAQVAFVQLAVAGTTGLLVYLTTAIPRKDLRTWISTARSSKAPLNPVAG